MTDKKPTHVDLCVIIAIIQGMYVGCRKLQNRNRQFQYAHKSLKSASTPSTMLVWSGKPNTCLISSSSKWVIDFGATYHMTGNFSLFTTFQLYPSTFTVTLVNGSTSCVLGSGTIHPTSLITLTSVMIFPQFSFNLIYVSKLTCTLNCNILFFFDYCLIQDFLMKRIIGRGRKSGGLYILKQMCQSLLLVLELLPHLNYIVAWVIILCLC